MDRYENRTIRAIRGRVFSGEGFSGRIFPSHFKMKSIFYFGLIICGIKI